MPKEVHVTVSQADAAKLIVERNSANGKPTPQAIRKIAEAQHDQVPAADHAAAASSQAHVVVTARNGKDRRLRALLARLLPGKAGAA